MRFFSRLALLLLAPSLMIAFGQGQRPTGGGTTGGTTGGGTRSIPTPSTGTTPRQAPQMSRPYIIQGTVRMEEGGPVSRRVVIQRVCGGNPIREGYTDSGGYFSFEAGRNMAMLQDAATDSAMLPSTQGPPGVATGPYGNPGGAYTGMNISSGQAITAETLMMCDIRAELPGYRSDEVELADKVHDFIIDVGTIILHPIGKKEGTVVSVTSLKAPKNAKKAMENGRKLGVKEKYQEALAEFQKAVQLDSDFAEALMAGARGDLSGVRLNWKPGPSVCVVLASGGYPGAYPTGKPIRGIPDAERAGCTVFHAGTRMGAQGLETVGGRVLGVTAGGADLSEAIAAAYAGVREIYFDGMHFRSDIGAKGLRRYNK
jgi:hypothetical protein